jgi:hypothetical protein
MSDGAGTAILAEIAALRAEVRALAAHLGAGPRATVSKAGEAGAVASDRELDGEYGDPQLKIVPKKLASLKGSRMSSCTAADLEEIAGFFDWKADKELEAADLATGSAEQATKRKYARFSRGDAAKARGWLARVKAGWKPVATANPYAGDGTPADNPWATHGRPQTRTNTAVDDDPFAGDGDEEWSHLP